MKKPPASKKIESERTFIFRLPRELNRMSRIICAEREISMAQFVRESLERNIENYKNYIRT